MDENIFISQNKQSFDTPSTIVIDRKFDTALRESHVKRFIDYPNDGTELDYELIRKHYIYREEINNGNVLLYNDNLYPRILKKVLSREYRSLSPKRNRDIMSSIKNVSHKNIEIQYALLNQHNEMSNINIKESKRSNFFSRINYPYYLSNLIDAATRFASIVEESNKIYTYYNMRQYSYEQQLTEMLKINSTRIDNLGLDIVWSHSYVLFRYLDKLYILPKPYILMIHNKLCDLISIIVLTIYSEGANMPKDALSTLKEFIDEVIIIAIRYQHKFYTIAKTLEALVTSIILKEVDNWDNSDFYNAIISELSQQTGFTFSGSKLESIMAKNDIPFLFELGCLSKIMGHPLVSIEEGCKKLYHNTHESYQLNMAHITSCANYIKENYIRNCIIREKQWPPHIMNYTMVSSAMVHASRLNMDPNHIHIKRKYGDYKLEDFSYIELLPHMRYSKLENVIPYLKDKTISVLRSRVLNQYIVSQNEQDPDDRPKWEDTRLLLAFILHPSAVLNHVKYIDAYERSPTLDDLLDYLVIRVVPKEKELKREFRGFGCKTYEDRMRSLAQEKNVMKFLDMYSDEQAMTLGELDIARRLNSFRRIKKAYSKHHVIYITLDASTWNNKFRPETVDDVMKDTLSKIFDNETFSKTQLCYQKSLIYVPDGKTTHYWYGQSGGIEGLNQDTWVVTYIAQIRVALRDQKDIKYHILCKGDDFRLAVIIPEESIPVERLGIRKTELVTVIKDIASQMGHKIKVDDSYGSARYFNFSKYASVDLVELPQGYRKIQKAYGANNAFLSTLDEYIGSTYSSAHSTCKVSPTVLPSYSVALFWSMYYLKLHPSYCKLSDDQLTALLLVPNLVGGFPVIYIHNMVVRAEADLLTPFLEIVQFTRKYYPKIHDVLKNFLYVKSLIPSTKVALYKDPYCLAIDRPELPTAYLRKSLLPVMHKFAKNDQLRELIKASKTPYMQELIKVLDNAKPFEVKILSNLYACLPIAILDEILKKFESARSIYEFLMRTIGTIRSLRILRNTLTIENRLQLWRSNRVKGKKTGGLISIEDVMDSCSYKWAYNARALSWGIPIEGITMPCLQHVLYQTTQAIGQQNQWCVDNHFTMYIDYHDDKYLTQDHRMHYQEGKKDPFIGYTTRTGNIEPKIHFIEKDVILTKIKNILDLVTWADRTEMNEEGLPIISNVREFIEYILVLYTDQPLSHFSPFQGLRKSGTFTHHGRAPGFRESIIPNTLSNIYQHVSGDSNTHYVFSKEKTGEHYLINFLHIFCHSTYLIMQELEYDHMISTPPCIWIVTTNCKQCITPIRERPLVLDMTQLKMLDVNPLKYTIIDKTAAQILHDSMKEFHSKDFNIEASTDYVPLQCCSDGIFYELSEITYHQNNRIGARYNQHDLTSGAASVFKSFMPTTSYRDISLTELKALDIHILAQSIIKVIGTQYIKYIKTNNINIYEYVNCQMIPPRNLPWIGIVDVLFKAGRLAEVTQYLSEMANIPFCTSIYGPDTIAAMCGFLAARCYYTIGEPIKQLVILSNYAKNDISRYLLEAFSQQMNIFIANYKFFIEDEDYVISKKLCKAKKEDYLVLAFHLDNLDINMLDLNNIKSGEKVQLSSLVAFDQDMVPEIVEERGADAIEALCGYNVVRVMNFLSYEDYDEVIDIICECYQESSVFWTEVFDQITIEIYITTLATCILTVRNELIENPIHDRVKPKVTIAEQAVLSVKKPKRSSRLTVIEQTSPSSITIESVRVELPLQRDMLRYLELTKPTRRCLSPAMLYRYYGYMNASFSHCLDIWNDFKFPLAKNLNITVLGDGIGNVTAAMCLLHEGSSILFNTLVDNKAIYEGPTVPCSINTKSEIIWEHLCIGVSNLTELSTLEHYVRIKPNNSIIYCEAETNVEDEFTHRKIVYNAIWYYLQTRNLTTIVVIKLYLTMTTTSLSAITILSKACSWCALYSPPSMRCENVFFLIGYGYHLNINQFDPTFFSLDNYPTEVVSKFTRFQNKVKSFRLNIQPHTVELREVLTGVSLRFNPNIRYTMPIYWETKFHSHTGIILNKPQRTITSLSVPMMFTRLLTELDELEIDKVMKQNLSKHKYGKELTKKQAIDLNTRAHRDIVISRWAFYRGFYELCRLFSQRIDNPRLTHEILRMIFDAFTEELDPRDYDPEDPGHELQAPELHANGTVMPYWKKFIDGANLSLSTYGFFSILYNPEGRHDIFENA